MISLDLAGRYQGGTSRVHRLDPRTKLVAALLFIGAATLLPAGAWLPYALLFAVTLAVARASGLGVGYALRRSFVALPFALAAVTLPFTLPGPALAQLGPLTVSVPGAVRFASIVAKSWVSVQMAILLAATTPFPDIVWGLRALRVPQTLVSIIGFMGRYLHVLGDEALRLRRGRASRAATVGGKGGGSLRWRLRVAGGMVGNLGLRALERSERVHAAMASRGFTGEIRTLAAPVMADADWNTIVGWVTLMAMIVLIGLVF